MRSRSFTLLTGLVLSNLAFLLAAVLIYRLVRDLFNEEKLAERTLLLVFLFPTSFYFSAFYTESLFLLLALAAFTAAFKKRWLLAGLFASLLALTRVQGILITLPLFVLYMQDIHWNFKKIRANILSLAAPLPFLLAFSFYIDHLAGQSLALIKVQEAWGKFPGSIFEKLWIEIGAPVLDVFKFDFFFLLLFLITAILLMRKPKTLAYGIFVFLILIIPLASGSVISVSRYCLPCFPVFFYWAEKLKSQQTFSIVKDSLFTFQILFFLAWSNYYWVA